ncbi:MetQ/NlpA family ABC transporter substrate-binding protein [Periweissella fabaria]|uniref:Lipoprotein n=1 Tax=Periweissella fabaria TaxID=546157 RepID=A0ABM8Z878_9LACO|nr:MetQ/NlpA family ABC transporter substrate-binding protein [Periweissella fabaria]MCM0598006.1 MetQ/NlpA family ABC transporter substrate-binding protein [Periweissella fabaria]CAH0417393.1 putative D-methionine-binding lipoprotein MetQ [Periweissella fabaria]
MKKKLLIAVTAILAAFTLAACGNSNKSSSSNTVKIGVEGSEEAQVWDNIIARAKKEGVDIKLVHFNDYNQPNAALKSGQIDLNAYQHYYFLNTWNKANHANLKPIAKTLIAPVRLYGGKGVTKLTDIKDGSQIVIPNDPTNEGRALTLLQTAGLIKLKQETLPTPNDITSNPKKLKIVPVDATQTATQLKSVAGAVVNNDTATDAKLNPKSAIFVEPINKDSKPWINIIVANPKNADNPAFKKIIKIYQSQETKDLFKKYYPEELPAWDADLK